MTAVPQATQPISTPASTATPEATATSDEVVNDDQARILVAYFSRTGNTASIATMIAEATGAPLFKIEAVYSYPEDYNECLDVAQQEQSANVRPELTAQVEAMEDYDTVFVGYPNWWGTMPMALFTFLEGHDLSGKTIIPFCTHEGSALGRSERDIAAIYPDNTMLHGLAIRGPRARASQDAVLEWLSGLDIS